MPRLTFCSVTVVSLAIALLVAAPAALAAPTLVVSDTNSGSLYRLDPANASATLIGSFGVDGFMAGLAFDAANGILYGTTTSTDNLHAIDPITGAATVIGPLGASLMHALAFDSTTGTLYGAFGFNEGDGLYEIDTSDGTTTFIGNIGFFFPDHLNTVHGLAFHPVTHELYGSVSGPQYTGALINIDTTTGAGTMIGPTQALTGLAFHPQTHILYGVDNGIGFNDEGLYTVDIATGNATFVGSPGLENPLGLAFFDLTPTGLESLSWGAVKARYRTDAIR